MYWVSGESVVDADERWALAAEGLDPNDSRLVAAIDVVRWQVSLVFGVVFDGDAR